MRFYVNRHLFSNAVSNLMHAVSTRSTNPVLEGIYIKSEDNMLKLISYDYELGMITYIEPERIEEQGETVINARLLSEMMRRVNSDIISFNINEKNVCTVESNSTVYEIMGMPARDFPEMPKFENQDKVVIPSEQLKDMVRQTIFSVAPPDGQKPILAGENFDITETAITAAAIDGSRISVRRENLTGNAPINFTASAKAIQEAVKLIGEDDETIEMMIGRRFFSLTVNGYNIISRLMEGEYVEYEQILNNVYTTFVRVKTRDILGIIDRISLVISGQVITPIILDISKNSIVFSCKTVLGKAVDVCEVETDGEPLKIGFNPKFLYDALKATETDEVILKFTNSTAHVEISPIDGNSFTYVVMPMRTKEIEE